ncbi:MAG: hypothetical protein DWQ07_19985 [Chloroflexi bacterium]|nr:MAG: hypothetical protein DWQ07_19985 [Chloroflexota bacterium]MBL1194364.1 hypothetical protein [Chloroflexota bacterium]NOH11652.1 hypothetical protein [Chloroflexota bacterium]
MLFALVVYSFFALINGEWISSTNYFSYLADAFLHGQLHLRIIPSNVYDLNFFEGQYYLYWPPVPAFLLMPLVTLFGVNVSDVVITLLFASASVGLMTLLLRYADEEGIISVSSLQRGLLSLFFAFGTVHITIASVGKVWFLSQNVAIFFLLLTYIAAIRLRGWKAFLITGLLITCAAMTRNHLFVAGLWPAYHLLAKHVELEWKARLRLAILGLSPLFIFGSIYLVYNWSRFGHPLDLGSAYQNMNVIFVDPYFKYGTFSIRYLPTNFYYNYINYPFPWSEGSLFGGSLFLLSPVFFAAFQGFYANRQKWSERMLLITILLVNIPILLNIGTGWIQFGPRYTLDFVVPLMLLTAIGIRHWPRQLLVGLTILSILHYVNGTAILIFGDIY